MRAIRSGMLKKMFFSYVGLLIPLFIILLAAFHGISGEYKKLDDSRLSLAVNQVIQDGGGLCVVRNGQVQSHLPLPIAGLMSTDTAQSLAEQIDALKAAARECGPLPDEPFIQMAFLSLPVIPALKLTSQGLFDGEKFAFTTLEVTE